MTIPIVPYRAFCSLAGSELSKDTDRLLIRSDVLGVVLFSTEAGDRRMIVPVGASQTFEQLEQLETVALEGMRALCAIRLADVLEAEEKTRVDRGFTRREKQLAEREARLAAAETRLRNTLRILAENGVALPPDIFPSEETDSTGP